jgi:hypothetical protein
MAMTFVRSWLHPELGVYIAYEKIFGERKLLRRRSFFKIKELKALQRSTRSRFPGTKSEHDPQQICKKKFFL